MNAALPFRLLADAVLVLHFSFIVFVVGGLVVVVVGNVRGWTWVNRYWLRMAHLGGIGFVVVESWLEVPCPLTTLEAWLRDGGGAATYSQGFIEHWVQRVFAYEIRPWMFKFVDGAIGSLALFAWWRFPPQRKHKSPEVRPNPHLTRR